MLAWKLRNMPSRIMNSLNPTNYIPSEDSIMPQWLPTNFEMNAAFPVSVTHVNSPTSFFVQMEEDITQDKQYLSLEADMMVVYGDKLKEEHLFRSPIELMKTKYAVLNYHGENRRVNCLGMRVRKTSLQALVYQCDYGMINCVPWDKLMKLYSYFKYEQERAISCTLAHTVPKNITKPWTEEAIHKFSSLVYGKTLEARLVNISKDFLKMEVTLTDLARPDWTINDEFVMGGFATEGPTIIRDPLRVYRWC